MTGSKRIPAAAGILRDNHLLINGRWQGLTRLTDSHVLIVLAIYHLFGCPASEPSSPLRILSGRQNWPAITDTGKCQIPRYPASLAADMHGAGQSAAPAQNVNSVIRDTEKQQREHSQSAAVAAVTAAPMHQKQSPGPGWPHKGKQLCPSWTGSMAWSCPCSNWAASLVGIPGESVDFLITFTKFL